MDRVASLIQLVRDRIRRLRRQSASEPSPGFAAAWRGPEDKLIVIADTDQFDWRKPRA